MPAPASPFWSRAIDDVGRWLSASHLNRFAASDHDFVDLDKEQAVRPDVRMVSIYLAISAVLPVTRSTSRPSRSL
jgi:hypothetical protein